MRLDKYLAESSVGTRKKVRAYIIDGTVTVNGKKVKQPAMEVTERDTITYLGKTIQYRGKVYYLFNKPAGCVTARKDAEDVTVLDYFDEIDTGGIFPVGRLDKDTEGLLFLTNDGDFDHRLMNPDHHVDKKYFFWATGTMDEEECRRLEAGVSIGDGKNTKPAKIQIIDTGKYSDFSKELDAMGLKNTINTKAGVFLQPVISGMITISEGRKHQVKRMLRAVGCRVIYLKRVSVGPVTLDESLKKGEFRRLTEDEVFRLMER